MNSLGGRVFINANVQEIVTKNNKVEGIKVDDTFIKYSKVISNVGVNNTFNYLLSESVRKRSNFNLNEVKPAIGHICLYIGLNKSGTELNLPKHNVSYYAHENTDELIENANLSEAPTNFAYISFPSEKDPEWENKNPGTATIQAITVGNYNWFSAYEDQPWRNREETYKKIKSAFEVSMLKRLYSLFPDLERHVQVTEVSTPLSTRHFSNYKNGVKSMGLHIHQVDFNYPSSGPKLELRV